MSEERLQARGGGGRLKGTDPNLLKVLDLYDQGQRESQKEETSNNYTKVASYDCLIDLDSGKVWEPGDAAKLSPKSIPEKLREPGDVSVIVTEVVPEGKIKGDPDESVSKDLDTVKFSLNEETAKFVLGKFKLTEALSVLDRGMSGPRIDNPGEKDIMKDVSKEKALDDAEVSPEKVGNKFVLEWETSNNYTKVVSHYCLPELSSREAWELGDAAKISPMSIPEKFIEPDYVSVIMTEVVHDDPKIDDPGGRDTMEEVTKFVLAWKIALIH